MMESKGHNSISSSSNTTSSSTANTTATHSHIHLMTNNALRNQHKQKKKEKILLCLTKLGDKDTLKQAIDELNSIINELDSEGFVLIMSALCHTPKERKNFVRKESLKLLTKMSTSNCPVYNTFFSSCNLSKVLKLLRTSFQDVDGGVRETASEVYGNIVNNWVMYNSTLVPGNQHHPIIKTVLDGLLDPKKECQIASSVALANISEFVEPLAKDLIKEIFRIFKNPNFLGKTAFIPAISGWDYQKEKPKGFIKSNRITFIPHLNQLVGNCNTLQGTGTGLLNFVTNSEWMLRRNAVDALKAIAIIAGPALKNEKFSIISKIQKTLIQIKFDKVKPVREAITETLKIYDILSEYVEMKEVPQKWENWYCEKVTNALMTESIGNSSSSSSSEHANRQTFHDIKPYLKNKMQENKVNNNEIIIAESRHVQNLNLCPSLSDDGNTSLNSADTETTTKTPMTSTLHKYNVMNDEWLSMLERVEAFERQQNRLFEMIEHLNHKIDSITHSFKGDIYEIQDNMCKIQDTVNKCWESRVIAMPPNDTISTSVKWLSTPRPMTTYAPQKDIVSIAPSDLNSAYADALATPNNDLQIIRLIQRTGPVTHELKMKTLNELVLKFCQYLHEEKYVTRILPWLWQLADATHKTQASSIRIHIKNKLKYALEYIKKTINEETIKLQISSLCQCFEEIWNEKIKEISKTALTSPFQNYTTTPKSTKTLEHNISGCSVAGKTLNSDSNSLCEPNSWMCASSEG